MLAALHILMNYIWITRNHSPANKPLNLTFLSSKLTSPFGILVLCLSCIAIVGY